ncbi:MAG: L-aspartate oxidase [Candidatus Lokiarchaeota archaeon]|nr:L-aspartate oxidase [Candidatus Lokiarchaeota archaeon]
MFLASKLSRSGSVLVITKKDKAESNSANAQGGIAVVMSGQDTIEKHIKDTMVAGDGLCKERVVRKVVESAPRLVQELIDIGVPFTRNDKGDYDLGREGGHSERRVIHAGDVTGNVVQETLLRHIEHDCPDIEIRENTIAVNLITESGRCIGIHALDQVSGNVFSIEARFTVISTGGAGKVYLYTSNPDIATGDGIAMAYRAGVAIANMEFFQFHPTCLFHPYAKSFLISEALRGEGAILKNHLGERFMPKYHKLAELAPRDVVSRAIDHEMKRYGIDNVLLDLSFKPAEFIQERFPTIYKKCKSYGIDITKEPIPVVPAAHYTCGGIAADIDGTTNIPGLHAIGEASCSGLHGANRLASNSLLECVAMADHAAKYIKDRISNKPPAFQHVREWEIGKAIESSEGIVVKNDWDEIRTVMWNYVGIVRSMRSLQRAKRRIDLILEEIKDYYWEYLLTSDLIELRHLATVADLITTSAMSRRESRGTHHMIDFPDKMPGVPTDTIIRRYVG